MGDSLKDRLTQHSHAFESLLSLIPARYYYDEESNNQWKKKGARRTEEEKAEAKRNKKSKFDPESGSSALDELKRREQLAADEEDSSVPKSQLETDTNDVIIYDDNGNPINAEKELSVQELLQLKSIEKMKPGQYKLEPSNSDAKIEKAAASTGASTGSTSPSKSKKGKQQNASKKPSQPEAPVDTNEDADSSQSFTDSTADTPTPEEPTKSEQNEASKKEDSEKQRPLQFPSGSSTNPNKSKPGIEALRAKLAAKVDEMKAKRKAPGSNASGAPKNREELLAARKLKLEQKKKLQKTSNENPEARNETNPPSDDEDEDGDEGNASSPQLDMNLSYGQLRFKDGDKLGKDASSIEHQRKLKKRNAMDQLKVLENKKAKISKLDSEKQENIAENAKWSRAILQSEGAKVRDDEKLLKRTIKQNENRKKRSEKEWNRRIYQTKKGISDREAKRDANIAAHREAKKMKLKGRKRKDHMKKASSNFNART